MTPLSSSPLRNAEAYVSTVWGSLPKRRSPSNVFGTPCTSTTGARSTLMP